MLFRSFHRVFRDLHETACIDDSSFRQYVGRTHGNAGAYLPDFHLCKYGARTERHTDRGFRTVQHLYECALTVGSFHPGIRVYNAFGSVYRTGTRRREGEGGRKIKEN